MGDWLEEYAVRAWEQRLVSLDETKLGWLMFPEEISDEQRAHADGLSDKGRDDYFHVLARGNYMRQCMVVDYLKGVNFDLLRH